MSNVSEKKQSKANNTASLLFEAFVFVADADDGLSAREVQTFHDLVEDPSWCNVLFLRDGLDGLRASFADFWKDYQKRTVKRDAQLVWTKLNLVMSTTSGISRPEVGAAIWLFLGRILNNSSTILQRLGLSTTTPAKQKARQELVALLSQFANDGSGAPVSPRAQADEAVEPREAPVASASAADLSIWPAATIEFAAEKTWKRGRTAVRCIAIVPETHDVKTFVFQAVNPVVFKYKPGQFATLELPIEGKTVRRSYTISSSPSRPHTISITVKRVPGGLVSNWLHDNMVPGFQFNLSGPNGDFTCFDAPDEKLLFISGGSGITPVMSMLRWLVDTQSSANAVFINNVRTPADIIFEHELKYLGSRFGANLKLGIVPGAVNPGQTWNGPVTFFNEGLLRALAPDFAERTVFVCGPPPYMDAVRGLLEQLGFPMQRYHQESFGGAPTTQTSASQPAVAAPVNPPAVSKPSPAPSRVVECVALTPPTAGKLEIVFTKSGKTLEATTEDFILDLAEEHGIEMASSCRAGNCGTCKVKKVDGEVEMEEQRGLSESDVLDGYILACVGRAVGTRLVLEA